MNFWVWAFPPMVFRETRLLRHKEMIFEEVGELSHARNGAQQPAIPCNELGQLPVKPGLITCTYIYIGQRLGVPRKPIAIYLYGSAKCWFYTVFYSVFAFPSKCSISESINVSADKLGVCPRRKLHLPWMAKHVCNIFPIGIAVSCMFWVFVDKYKMS